MLIRDAIRRFLVYLTAVDRSPKTIRSYDERLQRFIRFSPTEILEDITSDSVDDYVVELRQSLSPISVADHIQALKAFLRWCVNRGLISNSPARHLRVKKLALMDETKQCKEQTCIRCWIMLRSSRAA